MVCFLRLIGVSFVLLMTGSTAWPSTLGQHYVGLIQSGDFTALEGGLSQLESSKEKNTDGIYTFYQVIVDVSKDLALDPEASLAALNKWCEQSKSHLSYLLRGRFYIEFAWADRGGQFANKVLPESWHIFEERLKLAQKDLEQAAALNPKSPEPWIALMVAFRGLNLPEKIAECFDKAVALDKGHYGAYYMMLIAKMGKWFGSDHEMFAFAEKTCFEHKDDPVFGFLLVESHDEYAYRQGQKTGKKKKDYFQVAANYDKVRAILDDILGVYPRSVKAHSWSAAIDFYAGKYKEALVEMTGMEDGADDHVWQGNSFLSTKAWLQSKHREGKF